MSEDRFENVMRELREAAPPAPQRLRQRVSTLRQPRAKRVWSLRPALVGAAALTLTVGLGAAAVGGLTGSGSPDQTSLRNAGSAGAGEETAERRQSYRRDSSTQPELAPADRTRVGTDGAALSKSPVFNPGSRLQQHVVAMNLRVRDLSRSTQTAIRHTRRLGGYIAAADYATGSDTGDSSLDLRVPVQNVQEAIARFTDLGTIVSQRISVDDLQAPLDRTDARIATARKTIAELEAKNVRTPAEQARLDDARRLVKRLNQSRRNIVVQATYAKISLQLTTKKAAAKQTEPGRFDRFWGDAKDILGKELIAVLYVLVVAGPFAILALLALLAARGWRRRSDHRLLGETG
jgi:Domain of unknown function (DUF4349)